MSLCFSLTRSTVKAQSKAHGSKRHVQSQSQSGTGHRLSLSSVGGLSVLPHSAVPQSYASCPRKLKHQQPTVNPQFTTTMKTTLTILTVSLRSRARFKRLHLDVLASFNKPNSRSTATDTSPATHLPPGIIPSAEADPEEDEDFDASLVEGMESLLRQLAGDHPPGPMPGTTDTRNKTGKKSDLSPEDEEQAFQRAIEMMLSTEGMAAMGLDDKDPLPPSTSRKAQPSRPSTKANASPTSKPDVTAFEETIRKAMESLNSAGGPAASNGGGGPSDPAELAKLLASLGNDPNLDLEGDDELSGILDGMMGQLMTREVLEEPLSELAIKASPSWW